LVFYLCCFSITAYLTFSSYFVVVSGNERTIRSGMNWLQRKENRQMKILHKPKWTTSWIFERFQIIVEWERIWYEEEEWITEEVFHCFSC
jgi:hypothetical protein